MYKEWILKWHELSRKLRIFCVNIGWWYCSVAKLHPILCNSRDCSMPSFPVLHYLLEFAQNQAHWVNDAIQPSHPLSSPSLPTFSFSHDEQLFHWVWRAGGKKKMEKKMKLRTLFMMSAPQVNVKWIHSSDKTGLIQHINCRNTAWSPRAYRSTYFLWAAVE